MNNGHDQPEQAHITAQLVPIQQIPMKFRIGIPSQDRTKIILEFHNPSGQFVAILDDDAAKELGHQLITAVTGLHLPGASA